MSSPEGSITCKEFADFLDDYLEGGLKDAQQTIFDLHMARCPCCVNYLETYKRTVALAGSLCSTESDELPAEVPEDLVTAVLAARRR